MFKNKDLSTQLTVKGFKGTVVNRALLSLHGESLEITLTVPFYWVSHEVYKLTSQEQFFPSRVCPSINCLLLWSEKHNNKNIRVMSTNYH